jgi:hypothetical protein
VQFRSHVHVEPVDHSALLTEITGISNLEQAESSFAFSRISSIPVVLFVSAREFLTFRLYQSFCNFMESLKVARMSDEIVHQVLFNPWIWCGSKGFDQIYRNWPTMLSHNVSLIKSETFTSFLIQCHLIVTRSSYDFFAFSHVRFRILEQLAKVLYIEHLGVCSVIAVIFTVQDNLNQLFRYMRLLTTIAKRNPACLATKSFSH